jgi:chemotaxis protein MotA
MGVILHALGIEMMIIGGGGLMTLLVANDTRVVGKVLKGIGAVFKGPRWKRSDYADLLCLSFLLIRTHQKEGPAKVERHIEKPQESPLFSRYPRVQREPALRDLICDTLRSVTLNNKDPHRVGEMMETSIEKRFNEGLKPAKALQTMADALPALGIVAAVLGVIKAMGAIGESPAILGGMIGSALVGTFLGVFLAYGLVGPLAARMKAICEEERRIFDVTRAVITSYLENLAPQLCVEIGRQVIPTHLQLSYDELEQKLRDAGRAKADGESEGE